MIMSHGWRSTTAVFMALSTISTVSIAPLAIALSEPYCISQTEPATIAAGRVIPVKAADDIEKIIVTPNETTPVTLTVASDIRSSTGRVLIPRGSQIEGELRPTKGGTQFVAEELIITNRRENLPINASSRVITRTQTITEKTDPDFLRGAALGAAAAALIAEIIGDIDLIEVLAGAGAGVLVELLLRGTQEVDVVVVYPNSDLDLTLQSDLVVR